VLIVCELGAAQMKNRVRYLSNVFTSEQFSYWNRLYYVAVKARELTPKQILSVPCTTCGAAVGEACELNSGALRTEPHRDRKLSAAEAVDTNLQNIKRK
jgi:hypothetical protein